MNRGGVPDYLSESKAPLFFVASPWGSPVDRRGRRTAVGRVLVAECSGGGLYLYPGSMAQRAPVPATRGEWRRSVLVALQGSFGGGEMHKSRGGLMRRQGQGRGVGAESEE